MASLNIFATEKLQELAKAQRKRVLRTTTRARGSEVSRDGKALVSFCCNDYLGLTHHPDVLQAAHDALDNYGAGAGAARLVTGNHPLYAQLEGQLAALKGTEDALVFGNGYLTNVGIVSALVGKGDLILADKFVHACLLDGAALSDAKLYRFKHNSITSLRTLLEKHRNTYTNCLILTDHVFSMDGDIAPVSELMALAKEYDAWLLTDDAHGLGLLPTAGSHLQMGTLSKAIGSYGGYICADAATIDYLRSAARPFVYSTALPPSVIASAIAALEVIQNNPSLGKQALANARFFTSLLDLPDAASTIVPLILGDEEKALAASAMLEDEGFLVSAIRPPTVPAGTARLRLTFSALHKQADIEKLTAIIKREGWV